ncbi:Hsp20/alpha crystallin family protein [Pontibacter arcticus]|uniref:Hsp20/alpha crystallin family protein n=1 Tax=Pontibacter arcticus TaxID=2080288 RepID=A0A364RHS2_9BACT|nr:Hsp20/alpha crystallin family protein [Pontibacter arcticus]RAU83827.1 Hsp20/alpha crystallin family protein [Pontibacter arcticus]
MLLNRRNGMQESMPSTFSSMLDRFFNESVNNRTFTGFAPQLDACETEQGYELSLALPGVKKEDIMIDFQEGALTISGERRMESKEENKRYHLLETQYGAFSRTLYLPDRVNPDKIEARLNDGILEVFVPKDEHKTKKRQISISDSSESSAASSENGRKEVKSKN